MQIQSIVKRHDPVLTTLDFNSPLSVGNGDFVFTADLTGLQTLAPTYEANGVPLCTMSQWGWHSAPDHITNRYYTQQDLKTTPYTYVDRTVHYASKCQKGNESVYHWLRENPHRFHLGRIALLRDREEVNSDRIQPIRQVLHLYEGALVSEFLLDGCYCRVRTLVAPQQDCLGIQIESELLTKGLQLGLFFPYGGSGIAGAVWTEPKKHQTELLPFRSATSHLAPIQIRRQMDDVQYQVTLQADHPVTAEHADTHLILIHLNDGPLSERDLFSCSLQFSPNVEKVTSQKVGYPLQDTFGPIQQRAKTHWAQFWETVGMVDCSDWQDPRGKELERRIVLSLYLLAIQSSGRVPPAETGLTCNSWYGKFHLEMHPWHSLFFPLWSRGDLLRKSLTWYESILPQACQNAQKNGYQGARWPKMVAETGIDSPSSIATLLIWQQPHLILMIACLSAETGDLSPVKQYWKLIKQTALFMCDFVVWNPQTKRYDLVGPLIPAQEEHQPDQTKNPTFELAYWKFALQRVSYWGENIGDPLPLCAKVAAQMAELPTQDGVYLAHERCPDTFSCYARDHPSMLLAFGFLDGESVDRRKMKQTLERILETWDFETMWGWDFALMAMTAFRLGEPEWAMDLLLYDTPKNSYVKNGHNYQALRNDLPVYLPGNGSLLLCLTLMLAGTQEEPSSLPSKWGIKIKNIHPFPF